MLISQGKVHGNKGGNTQVCLQCFSWGLKKNNNPKLNNSEFTGFALTWEISGEQWDFITSNNESRSVKTAEICSFHDE